MDSVILSAIQFYSAFCYPIFEQIGFSKAKQSADFCSEWSLHEPLWMQDSHGVFPKMAIPNFGEQSSIYAMAIMGAFIVWQQKGKSIPDSELLRACENGYGLWTT